MVNILARFNNKVRVADSGCHEWTGANLRGYGVFQMNGKARKAHRVAWEFVNGQIPDGMCVCHKCDNPSCVNPEHLFLGSHKDNNDDMRLKGRARYPGPSNPPSGESHHKSVLTKNDVIRIRRIGGSIPQYRIARLFNVSKQTVSAVLRREIWRSVEV